MGDNPHRGQELPADIHRMSGPLSVAQAFGVADVIVSDQPRKHRLPQQVSQSMAAAAADAGISKHISGQRAGAKSIVEFTYGKQSGIGSDPRAWFDAPRALLVGVHPVSPSNAGVLVDTRQRLQPLARLSQIGALSDCAFPCVHLTGSRAIFKISQLRRSYFHRQVGPKLADGPKLGTLHNENS